ncbi:hypothetical protein KsCSTR_46130 [Candidatus Kuenenia stuttgartiensis]|jgi:hypothetical protein|uniref:Uncharacterized protein n=1 Tax=Kuenenia stuttgartiensis TaxID=174633 RepID=Q1PWB5_KUEST|nr:hypothetical protein KsCSTR_46130 [Candidatus Kuenenia stuttgartiensis]TVM02173.1 MAG: hypothetical protein CV080_01860 [Candidatus Kuenenia stuttgartiensis]CAJ71527.1 unknown protein [Candidatus Kuenenia stuttgartiensis]SOH04928.1 hypothetical protein KSMBR1_2441 [Candidatus Kuenenia stuttgartiensis]
MFAAQCRDEAFARFGYERMYDNLRQMLRPLLFQKTKMLQIINRIVIYRRKDGSYIILTRKYACVKL